MIARLGQNLGIKLLSLVCSFALFLYVHKQQASELTFQVPLTVVHDPGTRVVEEAAARHMVRVTLMGPAERLKLLEAQTKAIATVHGRGGDYRVAVEVPVPPEMRDQVEATWQPRVVNIRLEERTSRRLPIQTRFNVQPPAGLSLGAASVEPDTATVSGWESDLRRVRRLQAVINSLSSSLAVDVVVPVSAVDSQGLEVLEGVQIQPPTVRVRAPLERSVWFKPVYVSPALADVPPTVRLRRISVTPRRLTLRGPEAVVGPVQFLETEPITIPDTPGVVDREARVLLPPGVKTEERPRVRVVIALQGGSP